MHTYRLHIAVSTHAYAYNLLLNAYSLRPAITQLVPNAAAINTNTKVISVESTFRKHIYISQPHKQALFTIPITAH